MAESKLVLSNGRAPSNKRGDLVTRKQVEDFVQNYVDQHIEFYMQQIPELVVKVAAEMMADMCAANGLTFVGPGGHTPSEDSAAPVAQHAAPAAVEAHAEVAIPVDYGQAADSEGHVA